MKKLVYILLPVLTILLMSHNTYAATLSVPVHMQATFDNPRVQCNTQTTWSDQCATSANPIYFIKMGTYNLDNFAIPTGNYYVEIILRSEGNLSITSASSFVTADIPSSTTLSPIEVEQLAYSSSGAYQYYTYRVLAKYTGSATPPVIELGVTWNTTPWLWGGVTGVDHITFWRIDDENAGTQDIVNAINNQSQQEQNAANSISNQSTSDMPVGDQSSATNLIGNIQGIFTQIGNIPVGSTCSVAGNFGNLNLGDLNFCTGKENLPFVVTFGAYCFELIFVVGASIILVKQVLSIFDWARA